MYKIYVFRGSYIIRIHCMYNRVMGTYNFKTKIKNHTFINQKILEYWGNTNIIVTIIAP